MLARWLVGLMLLAFAGRAIACPFCEATAPTWLQSIRDADAAVIGEVASVAAPDDQAVPLVAIRYRVTEVMGGKADRPVAETFELESLESPEPGTKGLLIGVGDPELSWSTLCELTPRRAVYLSAARKLPANGVDRWRFFYQYLEDADEELAADAYGEFAAASFAEVKAFAKHADRAQLWRWIESGQTPESRRGLYYTLLALRGGAGDAEKLARMMASDGNRPPGAFSALVACYLSLRGEAGLAEIDERYLSSKSKASDADVQAVIVALRFHGEEQHILTRERIARSFRALLDRPVLAGSVIADLARWQDWQSMPQLVKLFEQANEETAWVRIPIVAYLKVCPLEDARVHLEALRKIDPEAIENAEALSLFGTKLSR